jgi:hypothetical protein
MLGRLPTQEPIGLAGGVNRCAYAGNDPVTFTVLLLGATGLVSATLRRQLVRASASLAG